MVVINPLVEYLDDRFQAPMLDWGLVEVHLSWSSACAIDCEVLLFLLVIEVHLVVVLLLEWLIECISVFVFIDELDWLLVAALLVVIMAGVHWHPLNAVWLISIAHRLNGIVISDGWVTGTVIPTKVTIESLEAAMKVAFWVGAWIAHGYIILLTGSCLVGEQNLPLVLSWQDVLEVVTEQFIASGAWQKLVMVMMADGMSVVRFTGQLLVVVIVAVVLAVLLPRCMRLTR